MSALALRTLVPEPGAVVPERANVLRYLGYRPGKTELGPRVDAVIDAGIEGALSSARPRVAAGYCRLDSVTDRALALAVPGFAWESQDLARRLQGAGAVSLLAVTLGEEPAALVRRRFAEGEYAVATAIDAAGTALVQALLSWALGSLAAEAAAFGYRLTPPYSPGYGDWAITAQLDLANAIGDLAGVTCTPTCYLIPEKSMVALAGWVSSGAPDVPSGCAACLQPGCLYRQAPPRPALKGDVR